MAPAHERGTCIKGGACRRCNNQHVCVPVCTVCLVLLGGWLTEAAPTATVASLDTAYISTYGNVSVTALLSNYTCAKGAVLSKAVILSVRHTNFSGDLSSDCTQVTFHVTTKGTLLPGVANVSLFDVRSRSALLPAPANPLQVTVVAAPRVLLGGGHGVLTDTQWVIKVAPQAASPLPMTVALRLDAPLQKAKHSPVSVTQLTWQAHEVLEKQFVVHLAAVPAASGTVTASLVAVDNAQLGSSGHSINVTVAQPSFSFVPGSAMYRSPLFSHTTVAINITASNTSAFPSTLNYTTFAFANRGCDAGSSACATFLNVSGTLVVTPGQPPPSVMLDANWTLLPYDLEVRLGLLLTAVENARAAQQPKALALSVFGVPYGHCPPGTKVPASSSSLPLNESTHAAAYGAIAALTGIFVAGGGNCSGSPCRSDADPPFSSALSAFSILIPATLTAAHLVLSRSSTNVSVVITMSNCSSLVVGARYGPALPPPQPSPLPQSSPSPSTAKRSLAVGLPKPLPAVHPPRAMHKAPAAAAAVVDNATLLVSLPVSNQHSRCTVSIAATISPSSLSTNYSVTLVPLSDMSKVFLSSLAYVDARSDRYVVLCGLPEAVLSLAAQRCAGTTKAQVVALLGSAMRGSSTAVANLTSKCGGGVLVDDAGLHVMVDPVLPPPPSPLIINGSMPTNPTAVADANGTAPLWLQYNSDYVPVCTTNYPIVAALSIIAANMTLAPEAPANITVESSGTYVLTNTTGSSNSSNSGGGGSSNALAGGGVVSFPVIVYAPDGYDALTYTVVLYANATALQGIQNGSLSTKAVADAAGGASNAAVNDEDDDDFLPVSPARNCTLCQAGSFSALLDAQSCSSCPPGKYASTSRAAACTACPPGTFAFSFGSTFCRPCLAGTFASTAGSVSCDICPDGWTTSTQGAAACDINLSAVANKPGGAYELVLTFAVVLTFNEDYSISSNWSHDSGINGSSINIVSWLIRTDTASVLKIDSSAVYVSVPTQVSRYSYLVNVSATMELLANPQPSGGGDAAGPGGAGGAAAPPPPSPADLNADQLVEKLVNDPTTFARTSEATGAVVQVTDVQQRVVHLPGSSAEEAHVNLVAILLPCLVGTAVLSLTLAWLCVGFMRRRSRLGLGLSPCLSREDNYQRWPSETLGWPATQVAGVPAMGVETVELSHREIARHRTRSKPNSMVGLTEFNAEVQRTNGDFINNVYGSILRGGTAEVATLYPKI